MSIPDMIGIFGVICVQIAYAGLQLGRVRRDDLRYIGLNILGPGCILFSLVFDFNLASVIAQVLWILMTAISLMKALRPRSRQMPRTAEKCMRN
ncbi:hypothetical protein GPA27_05845 [Aromatoleum toluolicum]|uniref:Cyclic nucleotide-binding protein n=1 Tax=Aromatoleum toluolicum TaxID=90060 RepID=A0ABX1NC88_9RHOO|nr:cyclic nucleotide-binding protein [Aromatoleum toluolicum]NMF96907.1 hypothetical protein [Aromatoleum toluolicum]